MKYVALLRGINVGGNNTIKMAELKTCFEKLGLNGVSTYINSGNIIFSDEKHPASQLVAMIEKCIRNNFDLEIPVVVRGKKQIDKVVEELPNNWATDKAMRTDIIFLWDEVDYPEVIGEIKTNPDVDNLIYTPGAIIWNFDREFYKKSKMYNFIGTKVYKLSTARNSNTVRKIQYLMD